VRLARLVAAGAWAGPDAGHSGGCQARCWARVRDFRWEADHDFQSEADEAAVRWGEAVVPGAWAFRRGALREHRGRRQRDALQKANQAELCPVGARRVAHQMVCSGEWVGCAAGRSGAGAGLAARLPWAQREPKASGLAARLLARQAPQERQALPRRELVRSVPAVVRPELEEQAQRGSQLGVQLPPV